MTASMPSGDGTVTDGPTRSARDDEAAPGTGLEPDAGADPSGETASPAGRTILDGPALENAEMQLATDDLRSSEDKSAAAREIADQLAAQTLPTATDA